MVPGMALVEACIPIAVIVVLLERQMPRRSTDGYEIVHKDLLVWCPIRSPEDVPRLRVLFVLIEAAFSFLFWTMKSENKDYGMSSCCPWPRASFSSSVGCAVTIPILNPDLELVPEPM